MKSSFPELPSASSKPSTVYGNDPRSCLLPQKYAIKYYKNMPWTHPKNFPGKNCLLTVTSEKNCSHTIVPLKKLHASSQNWYTPPPW